MYHSVNRRSIAIKILPFFEILFFLFSFLNSISSISSSLPRQSTYVPVVACATWPYSTRRTTDCATSKSSRFSNMRQHHSAIQTPEILLLNSNGTLTFSNRVPWAWLKGNGREDFWLACAGDSIRIDDIVIMTNNRTRASEIQTTTPICKIRGSDFFFFHFFEIQFRASQT